jgi:hypothetical protein
VIIKVRVDGESEAFPLSNLLESVGFYDLDWKKLEGGVKEPTMVRRLCENKGLQAAMDWLRQKGYPDPEQYLIPLDVSMVGSAFEIRELGGLRWLPVGVTYHFSRPYMTFTLDDTAKRYVLQLKDSRIVSLG